MLKKEVTGSSELPGGAVLTHSISTVEPHQSLPHLEQLPVCSILQGSHQGWQHQHQAKHLLLFLAPLWQNDKAPCPGKSRTYSAEPGRTTAPFCLTLGAGKVRLHCQQLIFCTKWELSDWPGVRQSQGPSSEDMDLSVHNDPPCHHPPAQTCYVGWWAQAERAWHENGGRTNRRQLTGGAHHQMHTGARLPFLDTPLREGKRREERRWEEKHRNYSHISAPARPPCQYCSPWGRYKQQQKCTDTWEGAERVTIKEHDYTPRWGQGWSPHPLKHRGRNIGAPHTVITRERNIYASLWDARGCLYVLSQLRKLCSFPRHIEEVGRKKHFFTFEGSRGVFATTTRG